MPQLARCRFAILVLLLLSLAASACAPAAPPPPAAPTSAPPPAPAQPTAAAPAPTAAPAAAAKPPAAPKPLKKVIYSLASQAITPGVAQFWIGERLGYLKDEGLQVEVVTSDGAAQLATWLATNKIQFGVVPPDNLLLPATQGQNLNLLFVYLYQRQIMYQIAVKPDSPIKEWPQLEGKKIGVLSLAHPGIVFVKSGLTSIGRDPSKIEFLAVGQGASAAQMLTDGKVDALAHWDINYAETEALGFKLRYLPNPPFADGLFQHGVTVNKDYLKNSRDEVVGYLRAMSKAMVFGETNPEALLRVHWAMFPETKPKGKTDVQALQDFMRTVDWRFPKFLTPADEKDKRWGAYPAEKWPNYVKFLGLEGKVDVKQFYTNDLIDEVNKFDQQAIIQQALNYRELGCCTVRQPAWPPKFQ